jgi:hypothetical protein
MKDNRSSEVFHDLQPFLEDDAVAIPTPVRLEGITASERYGTIFHLADIVRTLFNRT